MTPAPPPHPQEIQDAEHLKLLSIFHYVLAALTFIGGCFPMIHVGLGWMMVSGRFGATATSSGGSPPPQELGWFFILVGGAIILAAWTFAVLLLIAGRNLSSRTRRTFCFVIACLSCAMFPLGTALGVFTILVLQRPSVRLLFERPAMGGYLNR